MVETLSSVCNVSISGNAVNVDSTAFSSHDISVNAAAAKPAPKPAKPVPAPVVLTDCGIKQWDCPKGKRASSSRFFVLIRAC